MKRQRQDQHGGPRSGLRVHPASRLSAWVATLGVAAFAFLLVASSASASVTYTTGTPMASGNTNIYAPDDVSVDQSTGDVYLASPHGEPAIAHFDSSGNLLNTWENEEIHPAGATFDPVSNGIYVYYESGEYPTEQHFISAFADNGTELSLENFPADGHWGIVPGLGSEINLEVDSHGDIYFADRVGKVYRIDHNTGLPNLTLTCADCPGHQSFVGPTSVAVDGNGSIYVSEAGDAAAEPEIPARVVKFHPDGTFDSVLTEFPAVAERWEGKYEGGANGGEALAADPVTNDVFLGTGEGSSFHIVGFNAAGEQFAEFGSGAFSNANAGFFLNFKQLAVDGTTGTVYASDRDDVLGSVARVFDPDPALLAETLMAEEVGPTSSTVLGIVNPNGQATTECKFEYGTTNAYGESAPCATSPGNASTRTPVSADLSGLESGVKYHFRVMEKTGSGTVHGADQTFTTPLPERPVAITGAASDISQTAATLGGKVNPEGGSTTCEFEYGTTASYGSSAPCADSPGSGSGEVAVGAALSGLTAGTTYHFRISATNAGGTSKGADATFTTSADTCATKAALCPPPEEKKVEPPPPPKETQKSSYGQCVKSANKAYKKALKQAKSKHGKARANAIKAAQKKKGKLVAKCKTGSQKQGRMGSSGRDQRPGRG